MIQSEYNKKKLLPKIPVGILIQILLYFFSAKTSYLKV